MGPDRYEDKPWLAAYPPHYRHGLVPDYSDMLSAFQAAVAAGGEAVRYFGKLISYRDLDLDSQRLAGWASRRGIKRGDRVAIILQNVPSSAIAAVAAWKLGAIPCPMNPMYRTNELARIFADSEPSLIICHDENEETVRAALANQKQEAEILVVSARDHTLHAPLDFPSACSGENALSSVLTSDQPEPPQVVPTADDIGLLLYTSGTTGVPKGAMIAHRSLARNAQAMADWCEVGQDGQVLGIAPLFHITGFALHLCLAIVKGATLLLCYRFDPNRVLDVIRQERPTYVVGAITAFNALACLPGVAPSDFASLRRAYSGGAPIAVALRNAIEAKTGLMIHNCYGMTETTAPTHACPPGKSGRFDETSGALSIGVPIFGTEAKIATEKGEAVPVGDTGEIWVRGEQVMLGYWRKPEDTASVLQDGWMRTGDVGFMDDEGWFYIIDRIKDMINASGFKVWPREVEDVLHHHPSVREAAVIGVPDDYRGETVVAYVSGLANGQIEPETLVAHCRTHLAAYKCPRTIYVMAELPKTLTGKIQRNVLREHHKQES